MRIGGCDSTKQRSHPRPPKRASPSLLARQRYDGRPQVVHGPAGVADLGVADHELGIAGLPTSVCLDGLEQLGGCRQAQVLQEKRQSPKEFISQASGRAMVRRGDGQAGLWQTHPLTQNPAKSLDRIAALERTPKPFSAPLSRGLCVCYPLHRSGIATRRESLWCTAGYSCFSHCWSHCPRHLPLASPLASPLSPSAKKCRAGSLYETISP